MAVATLGVFVLVEVLFGDPLVRFVSDLLRGFDAAPDWIVVAVAVGTRVVCFLTLAFGLAVTIYRTRWRMLATVGLAALIGVGGVFLLADVPDIDDGHVAAQVDDDVGVLTDGTSRPPRASARWRQWSPPVRRGSAGGGAGGGGWRWAGSS